MIYICSEIKSEKRMENFDWTMFFDECAGDMHPTFKKEISKQLFEKIVVLTGIKQFEKQNFQLIIGMDDMHLQVHDGKMFALIKIVTPQAMGLRAWIYWHCASFEKVEELHKQDISEMIVDIDWHPDFPLLEVLSCARPRKKERKERTGYGFDLEFYHYSFPDVSIELHLARNLKKEETECLRLLVNEFSETWNNQEDAKAINFFHLDEPKTEADGVMIRLSFDFGQNSDEKIIKKFVADYAISFPDFPTKKICVK